MGTDIFARWDGQSEEERQRQYKAILTVVAGHVGYLREACEPYATQYLVAEAFKEEVQIPAAVLRERLPKTLELVRERERDVHESDPKEIAAVEQSFVDFVELCEAKEDETGEPVTIIASY